jgi:hypothetical protein
MFSLFRFGYSGQWTGAPFDFDSRCNLYGTIVMNVFCKHAFLFLSGVKVFCGRSDVTVWLCAWVRVLVPDRMRGDAEMFGGERW